MLSIPPDLRDRVRAWVDEYTAFVEGTALDAADHDRRGYALSRELQEALGPDFRILYHFETKALQQQVKQQRRGSSGK